MPEAPTTYNYYLALSGLMTADKPERKYTYPNANSLPEVDKPKATDNIMSYYHEKRSTVWQWQRKFIIIPKKDL